MKKSKLYYLDKEGKKNKVKTGNLADMGFKVEKSKIKYITKNDFETELNNFLFFNNNCNRRNLLSMINNGIITPFTIGEIFYDFSTEGKIKIANLYSIILAPEKSKEDLQIFRSEDELYEFLKIYYFLKENHKKAHIVDEESSILFFNKKFKYQLILPHKGTKFKYMLRKAKIKNFDRWANSTKDQVSFDNLDNLIQLLELKKINLKNT